MTTSKSQIAELSAKDQIAGAIIAGGHSRRFGPSEKALAMLAGLPLIEHLYKRLSPQVSKVWLNLANDIQQPKSIRGTLINDATSKRDGPLAGVLSALRAASSEGFEWLLIAPCDTPFIPMDLAKGLPENVPNQRHCLVLQEPRTGITQAFQYGILLC